MTESIDSLFQERKPKFISGWRYNSSTEGVTVLILFRPSPQSIVKAFMAGRVHRAKPIEDTEDRKFYFEDVMDASSIDYDSVYEQYKELFGGLDFLEDTRLWEIMEDEIFWASRYSSRDRVQLIFGVLSQIERNGTKTYLGQQSPETREMKDRVRRVTGEFRRAKQFLVFAGDEENKAMVAKGSLEHRIMDLVLRHFARRYPGYSIVVLDDEHAHILYRDELLLDERRRFPERPGRRDASRYWMLLTDPKNLDDRKDKSYYLSELPRNYWKWVSEGAQASGAAPAVTLDSFAD
jgi:hypothetical protein